MPATNEPMDQSITPPTTRDTNTYQGRTDIGQEGEGADVGRRGLLLLGDQGRAVSAPDTAGKAAGVVEAGPKSERRHPREWDLRCWRIGELSIGEIR